MSLPTKAPSRAPKDLMRQSFIVRKFLEKYPGAAGLFGNFDMARASLSQDLQTTRRSTDNASDSFRAPSMAGNISDFVGTGATDQGYTTLLTNQGSGNDATQTTAAAQPQIVVDGVVQTFGNRPTLGVFDGASKWYDLGDMADLGTGAVTVCHWIKSTQTGDEFRTTQKRGTGSAGSAAGWQVARASTVLSSNDNWRNTIIDDGGGSFVRIDDQGNLDDALDGTWHHLAFVFDVPSQTITAYLDGVDQNVTLSVTGTVGDTTTARHATIGAAWDDAATQSQFFDGQLDAVVIYQRVMTAAEINDVMNLTDPR